MQAGVNTATFVNANAATNPIAESRRISLRHTFPPMEHPPENSERTLVDRFRAGDEAAFAAVFDGWSGAVHRVATRILKDATEAEEVVEDTFWQAWQSREQLDADRGTLTGWLLSIARSRALDRLRASGRRREVNDSDGVLQRVAAAEGPDALEVEESARLVRSALEDLPGEQREVLVLAYFDGLTQNEIAMHTGQPLGTIKTRVRLGLAKLRDRLGAGRLTS